MKKTDDLISRQAAIEAVTRLSLGETDAVRLAMRIVDYLERLSPARLGTNLAEVGTDCISRQQAIDAVRIFYADECALVDGIEEVLNQLPSAQPSERLIAEIKIDGEKLQRCIDEAVERIRNDTDEWCTDCSEYDSERHCCPRFNRVIRDAVEEAKGERKMGHWIDTGSGQECSVCGEIQYGYDNGRNFCPNCGAKMEGEKA